MDIKLHFNLELFFEKDGIDGIVDITPSWLWNLIPDKEHENVRGSGDYCKGIEWKFCGKLIKLLFMQNAEHRPVRMSSGASPTPLITSPINQFTGRDTAHASHHGEVVTCQISEVVQSLCPKDRQAVLDFSAVILYRQLTGKSRLTSQQWHDMKKRAQRKMIRDAKTWHDQSPRVRGQKKTRPS